MKTHHKPLRRTVLPVVILAGAMLMASLPGHAQNRGLPDHWIDGTDPDEPAYQVHEFAEGTWIIRQSLTTHFEGPFIYLLAGNEQALLLDTGAPTRPWLRALVDELIGSNFSLAVAHSHAHSDHVAGDHEFEDRANTRIVGHKPQQVAKFFGIRKWPEHAATIELGNRPLQIIPIPGHEPSSVAIYDPRTGILLTGDTLYPGRLYVNDFEAYRDSIDRLVNLLSEAGVSCVLGSHIEMTNHPGQDFGPMQPRHPNERRLELEWRHVLELQQVLSSMDEAQYTVSDDFIVYPVN
jgi:hydroxyacylglutathione hydrolase